MISDAAICEFALNAFDYLINTENISLDTLLDEYTKNLTYAQSFANSIHLSKSLTNLSNAINLADHN